MKWTRYLIALLALALVVAACGSGSADDEAAETTQAPGTTTTAVASEPETAAPATAPAEVVFAAQSSDGSSILVASVTLPSGGFIAVHASADGAPGPVVGHSDLLPAGTSTDVVVVLDEPLAATGVLFPMAHIDMDGDGVYTFAPPDNAIDIPAATADGGIAVVGAEVTVTG